MMAEIANVRFAPTNEITDRVRGWLDKRVETPVGNFIRFN
jgi:hypothetical protein